MDRKVLLMILDGWGEGRKDSSNAIYTQGQPFIDSLRAKYPFSHLQACGEYVGLPLCRFRQIHKMDLHGHPVTGIET